MKSSNVFIKLSLLASFSLFLEGAQAQYQSDPSSAILLRSSGKAPSKKDLDSSRYQVRERPLTSPDNRRLQSSPRQIPPKPVRQPEESVAIQEQPLQEVPLENSVNPIEEELKSSGIYPDVSKYRRALSAEDSRKNIIDLYLVPIYIYNSSDSNYWYRRYFTSSPGFHLGAEVWLTPFLGIHTSYQTSLNASVSSASGVKSQIPVDHEWFHAGLRYRKFFGLSPSSSGIVFKLDFSEYQLKLSRETANRIGVKSTGVRLGVEAVLPTGPNFHWLLGFDFIPRIDHKQTDTGVSVESGDGQESSRLGFHVGGKFVLSRKNQVFWKVSHEFEKNLFGGQSSVNDPRTGVPVEGVSVTNSFTIFSLGYTWGN